MPRTFDRRVKAFRRQSRRLGVEGRAGTSPAVVGPASGRGRDGCHIPRARQPPEGSPRLQRVQAADDDSAHVQGTKIPLPPTKTVPFKIVNPSEHWSNEHQPLSLSLSLQRLLDVFRPEAKRKR